MPHLTLKLLGQFQALLDGTPVTGFTSDKTRALLAYLAIESDRPHRREVLSGLLWPDTPEAAARQSLSQALSNLRKVLGPHDGDAQPFLLTDRDTVQFNRKADYALDVNDINDTSSTYPGPLLDAFTVSDAEAFEEWLLLKRESLQRVALNAFEQRIRASIERDDYSSAIALAHKQLEIDPWREETHRLLMTAYALSGQRSNALAQYEKCRKVLKDVFGVEPDSDTQALLARIQKDELQPAGQQLAQSAQASVVSPAASPAASAVSLPVALTPFIGREAELAQLARLIDVPDARLVTLVGVGGIGKTRLAAQAAARAQALFAQGVAFVPLATAKHADHIVPVIVQALQLSLRNPVDLKSQVFNYLQQRHMLLVIDNIEHLLADSATVELLTELLQTAPSIKLLVTSREALNMQGEWVVDMEGLGQEAQMLFIQTARRAQARWQPSADDEAHIARICQLVGGLPLGVELAASWVRLLSCSEIADEIARNISFLSTNARNATERHRSITAVFDSSWRLLTDDEKRVMGQLSVFRGGFSREAAGDVAGASLPLLSSLVSKSLVQRAKTSRYDLHELVRQYAEGMLRKDDGEIARRRHAAFYLRMAEAGGFDLDPTQRHDWFDDVAREQSNLYLVLDGFIRQEDADCAVRMAGSLWRYWYRNTREWHYGRQVIERVKALAEKESARLPMMAFAHLLTGYGALCTWDGDLAASSESLSRSVALLRSIEPSPAAQLRLAYALGFLGWTQVRQGHTAEAVRNLEESIALLRLTADKRALAHMLRGYRMALEANGQLDEADAIAESVALYREVRDEWGLALALSGQGESVRLHGRHAEAESLYTESLSLMRRLHDPVSTSLVLSNLTHALVQQGKRDKCVAVAREGAMFARDAHSVYATAYSLLALSTALTLFGDVLHLCEIGVQLLGAASTVNEQLGLKLVPVDQAAYRQAQAAFEAWLTPEQFKLNWQCGQVLSPKAALDLGISTLTEVMDETLRDDIP